MAKGKLPAGWSKSPLPMASPASVTSQPWPVMPKPAVKTKPGNNTNKSGTPVLGPESSSQRN
jgi:hypothetical protein